MRNHKSWNLVDWGSISGVTEKNWCPVLCGRFLVYNMVSASGDQVMGHYHDDTEMTKASPFDILYALNKKWNIKQNPTTRKLGSIKQVFIKNRSWGTGGSGSEIKTVVYCSNFRLSDTLFWPPWPWGTYMVLIYECNNILINTCKKLKEISSVFKSFKGSFHLFSTTFVFSWWASSLGHWYHHESDFFPHGLSLFCHNTYM